MLVLKCVQYGLRTVLWQREDVTDRLFAIHGAGVCYMIGRGGLAPPNIPVETVNSEPVRAPLSTDLPPDASR